MSTLSIPGVLAYSPPQRGFSLIGICVLAALAWVPFFFEQKPPRHSDLAAAAAVLHEPREAKPVQPSRARAGKRAAAPAKKIRTAASGYDCAVQAGGFSPMLHWPVAAKGITSPFGHRWHPVAQAMVFHNGIDIAADRGEVVVAAHNGTVVQAGWNSGHGLQVVLSDEDALNATSYSHLARIVVTPGAYVLAGQPIGSVGTTGRTTGPHLHFEVTRRGTHTDPLPLLLCSPDTFRPPNIAWAKWSLGRRSRGPTTRLQ